MIPLPLPYLWVTFLSLLLWEVFIRASGVLLIERPARKWTPDQESKRLESEPEYFQPIPCNAYMV